MYVRPWSAGALVLCLLALAVPARADDFWTAPYPGVRRLHRVEGGVDLHAVLVDLTDPAVSVVATRPGDRFTTVSEFARRYDAQVAINANFYGRGSCGLAMGDGELFERAYEDGCGASMAFGRANESGVFDSRMAPRGPVPAAWITEVMTGKPWLMRDGRPTLDWVRPQHIYRPNPRTVAGISADRRTLVLLAADGRRRGVEGLTGFQLVRVLRELGCADAINLDGGGSTTLVVGGRVVNHPSDRRERAVMTHFGVRIRPGSVWYAGAVVARGHTLDLRQDGVGALWVDVRNTGRQPWRPPHEGGGSPTLELDDGAMSYVASVERFTPPGAIGRFELRWLARAPGERTLHARLVGPDGARLVADEIPFGVAVASRPRGPRRGGPALAVLLPTPGGPARPGFSIAAIGAGCSASPAGSRAGALGGLLLAAMLLPSLRRRFRGAR